MVRNVKKFSFPGYYLDGKTADRKEVDVLLTSGGLHLKSAAGDIFWPYREVRRTEEFGDARTRLERGGELPEVIIVRDPDFVDSLRTYAPNFTRHIKKPLSGSLRFRLIAAAGIGVIAAGLAVYLWGIPLLARAVTPLVPVSWEQALGESALDMLAPGERRIRDEKVVGPMREIAGKLLRAAPGNPYSFEVIVLKTERVNAIALPGGKIIVFQGLIRQARSPDEIAGVLAHEMQHVLKRHSTKRIIQHSSTGIIIAAVSGDVTGAMAYGVQSATAMAALRYSRQDETEADSEGAKMMIRAGINPGAMASFFEQLRNSSNLPEIFKYLSTHPDLEERISRIREIERSAEQTNYVDALSAPEWARLKQAI